MLDSLNKIKSEIELALKDVNALIEQQIPAPVKEVYVSTSGKDTNPGTIELPLRTIKAALAKAQAGFIVYIRAGTYSEMVEVFNKAGSQALPILITAYLNEKVIIKGVDWVCVNIRGSQWVFVNGIEVTGASGDGIFISNAKNVTVNGCAVYSNGGVGIHLASTHGVTSNNTVSRCTVHNNGQEGIYLDVKTSNPVAVDYNVIEDNLVYLNGFEGIQNTNQGGGLPKPNGTVIVRNKVEDNKGDWAALDLGGNGLQVAFNHVVNTKAPGGGIYYAGGKGSLISNNEVHNSYLNFAQGDGIVLNNVSGTTVKDNVVFSSIGVSKTGVSVMGASSGNTMTNNVKTVWG